MYVIVDNNSMMISRNKYYVPAKLDARKEERDEEDELERMNTQENIPNESEEC